MLIETVEKKEWQEALDSIVNHYGLEQASELLSDLMSHLGQEVSAQSLHMFNQVKDSPKPDQINLTERMIQINRWNAACMVVRAAKVSGDLGGHIATYASIAVLYEVGWNYCFHADDMIFFQGHSAPGVYARAFLEGRLGENHLSAFRRETADGLPSYPHPKCMPSFWQFPTVSMGLGPLQAVYQARLMKNLIHRGLIQDQQRRVWAFCGDGEMDEPESLSGLSLAAREKLDNLIFVINANLQRLDGPVRGNGSIIIELERVFLAHQWHVIKVIWSHHWASLWDIDHEGWLKNRISSWVDGDIQQFSQADVPTRRRMLFEDNDHMHHLNAEVGDELIASLDRGGHDIALVHAAMQEAMHHQGSPSVILVHSLKGHGMPDVAAENTAHNFKKMTENQLIQLGHHLEIPLSDKAMKEAEFYKPNQDAPLLSWLTAQRQKLGGRSLPYRKEVSLPLDIPAMKMFDRQLAAIDKPASTTMIFVRLLMMLLRQPSLKPLIMPIVADESRTFGMEGLFKQLGIYSPDGQHYTPVDQGHIMPYLEKKDGQLFQEGINEAGAMASWMAVGTAYVNHEIPLIPFYIYYSMFGFQRIGDLAWAAGDMLTRGFLLGATSGRTTLEGEGLQHTDGHSHVFSSTIPNCKSYDPCFSYELAVIMHQGLVEMYQQQKDVFYYITLTNETYTHPSLPADAEKGIIKGAYCLQRNDHCDVVLLGSGAILREVLKAAETLKSVGIQAEVWSVTSFTELAREGKRVARHNSLNPEQEPNKAYVTECFPQKPIVAASDYMKIHAEQIRPYLTQRYLTLGTDGFGLSDTRSAMRAYFEVDAAMIAYQAAYQLWLEQQLSLDSLTQLRSALSINQGLLDPIDR
ncbi:MAG: pyruvate dehydrogenase (acetyl-transferring), homodimeric type [Candidatus Comchoanobacterales bacterium]